MHETKVAATLYRLVDRTTVTTTFHSSKTVNGLLDLEKIHASSTRARENYILCSISDWNHVNRIVPDACAQILK